MKWPWTKTDTRDPASGECQHSFSDWSAPVECEVTTASGYASTVTRAAWIQSRHCLKCNMYERHIS